MPIAWSSGSTVNFVHLSEEILILIYLDQLGPIIGGFFARPAERFPFLFGENAFLKEYPYFLPCAIPAIFSLIAWLVTLLFLKETLSAPISIGQLFNIPTVRKKPMLQTSFGTMTKQNENFEDDYSRAEKPLPLRFLLTPRVLIAAGNYATVALVDIAFKAIQPVFLSTPIHLGGLGLSLPLIGTLLSVQGILGGIFQVFFFAPIHDHWGSKKTFIAGVAFAMPIFVMFPIANALARTQGYSIAVWAAIGFQTIAAMSITLSYGQCSLHNLQIVFFSDRYVLVNRRHFYLHNRRIAQPCIPRSYKWPQPGAFLLIHMGARTIMLIIMTAVSEHYAGNWANCGQLSFFFVG